MEPIGNLYKALRPYGNKFAALLTNDVSTSTRLKTITAEAVTLATGAAGTTGTIQLAYNKIYNSKGSNFGYYISATEYDTSFSFTTGTILTTQIEYKIDKTDSEQLAEMSNGQFAINYMTGLIRYKKATTGTSDTVNYLTRISSAELEVQDIQIGAVEIKNATTDDRVIVKDGSTFATTDMAMGVADANVLNSLGIVNTNLGDIETDIEETNTLLGDGNQKTQIVDGSGNVIGSTSNALDVNIKSGVTLEVNLDNADDDVLVYGWDGAANQKILTHTDGSLKVYSIDQNVNVVTNLDAFDFATETTLSNIDTNLTDVIDTSAHIVRVAEQDPVIYNFTPEVICDITNGTDGTYSFYTTGDTFNEVGTQLLIDGGSGTATVTIEVTAQDDGTAPASCVYVDVTNARFGAANFTASNYLFDTSKVLGQVKYIKYKVVLDTGGANDADVKIMIKKK